MGVISLSKEKRDNQPQNIFEDEKGVAAVQNQLNESYQSGVIEQRHNNKGIYTFNNRKN
ncbi:hypothetical protein BN990_01610 [Virgibacillus salexigens]|uniref:Uncharacterized protein n=1 Tax=Virgibacillus massiliensis TaxID=1462526 RepID=A0A024QAR8_9BACI|nr:hypothetical protein BN990_01610 [Virgibacillus massiliensis]